MPVYYNEIDKFCCDWLRELINRRLLPDGEIDNRSIEDVKPDELQGFTQCHFFAGIGGWAYALRLAGWPNDKPIWSGSCPCQPFSTVGKRTGFADERHLWPAFFHLISQCHPDTIIGEQVASKDALAWWDVVQADLEAEGYACGVCDTCAAGFGAPHIRQRLYWVAHSAQFGWRGWSNGDSARVCGEVQVTGRSTIGELEYTRCAGLQGQSESDRSSERWQKQAGCPFNPGDVACRMDNSEAQRCRQEQSARYYDTAPPESFLQGTGCASTSDGRMGHSNGRIFLQGGAGVAGAMPTNGFWANPDWLWCRDKKWRPIESGTVPLVDGLLKGVVRGRDFRAITQRLRGYGNAIVIPQAVEFIKAVMEVLDDTRG